MSSDADKVLIYPFTFGLNCLFLLLRLSKMGNLDLSISIMEQGKNSRYYTPKKIKTAFSTIIDDTFKSVIDNHLREYLLKKEKGYVYKPRKKQIWDDKIKILTTTEVNRWGL